MLTVFDPELFLAFGRVHASLRFYLHCPASYQLPLLATPLSDGRSVSAHGVAQPRVFNHTRIASTVGASMKDVRVTHENCWKKIGWR